VIAYGLGGARDSVIDGETGLLFAQQTAESLSDAILRFEDLRLDEKRVRENASRFSRGRFLEEFAALLEDLAPDRVAQ
jgi:glycosyltransferase involved in cell wall biosynthesis